MRKLLYIGLIGLVLFEMFRIYLIMPFPGSQEGNWLGVAYFLHNWRWAFRVGFFAVAMPGLMPAFRANRWSAMILTAISAGLVYVLVFIMSADGMFLKPNHLQMLNAENNQIKGDKLVMGIAHNGESKAYPIQLIAYHHQVMDTVGGMPVMVTYCSVCRTGRVFRPIVNGKLTTFRLVGMDHFNAMFEDEETGSWWRQASGEAVAGPLKGQFLPEISADHTSLSLWFAQNPNSTVMQPDPEFLSEYASLENYDLGIGESSLTTSDSTSWAEKSWVVGIAVDTFSKAYPWMALQKQRVIEDRIGKQAIVFALAKDKQSFFAFHRPDSLQQFRINGDTLSAGHQHFNLLGQNLAQGPHLQKINAYQEFWHSWRTFHPRTEQY